MVTFKREYPYIYGKMELNTTYISERLDGYLLIYPFAEGSSEHLRFNQIDIDKYIDKEWEE